MTYTPFYIPNVIPLQYSSSKLCTMSRLDSNIFHFTMVVINTSKLTCKWPSTFIFFLLLHFRSSLCWNLDLSLTYCKTLFAELPIPGVDGVLGFGVDGIGFGKERYNGKSRYCHYLLNLLKVINKAFRPKYWKLREQFLDDENLFSSSVDLFRLITDFQWYFLLIGAEFPQNISASHYAN